MGNNKKSFALGYSYVVHSFISYMLIAFIFIVFSNTVIPDFVEKFGWSTTILSTFNSVGAVTAAILSIFIGQWVEKKGAKQVLIIGFLVGGVNMIIFSFCSSLAMFCVHMIIAHVAAQMYCQMTSNNLLAHWFVKKKGTVLGVATAGLPAGTSILMPLYTAVAAYTSMQGGMTVMGVIMLVMGVVSIFWVKDTPAEVGLTPDNLPIEEARASAAAAKTYTFRQLLGNKAVWALIIVFGFMFLSTIASSSQRVLYFTQSGFDTSVAIAVTSSSALCGILGSVIFGVIDQKWGTKFTTIVYCSLSVVSYLVMYLLAGNAIIIPLSYLSAALTGAPGNLLPSYLITLFGPESFNSASKIITPVVCLFRALGYVIAAGFAIIFAGGLAKGIYLGLAILMVICVIILIPFKTRRIEID